MLFFEGCFYLSTIDFTYSHATDSHILQYQRLLLPACGAHPSTLIVTWLFQIVRWRENQKNNWKVIMDVYLIFWIKFQNCFISTCFISLTFDISSAFRFVFWCSNHGCALIQPYTCVCNMCIISSFVINSSVGFIISVHTSPCFFAP